MSSDEVVRLTDELTLLAGQGSSDGLARLLGSTDHATLARALDRMDPDARGRVLTTLDPAEAADLLEAISETQAAEVIQELEPKDAASVVTEMESDERADLIGALVDEQADAILSEMDSAVASDTRRLAEYEGDVAGGLMVTEFAAVPTDASIERILQKLRAGAFDGLDVQYVYVVDEARVLVGVLRLRDLVTNHPGEISSRIMIREPIAIGHEESVDELDALLSRHSFLGVPVVDSNRRLIGVVRRHDVEAALGDRAEDELRKTLGIVGGEELRSMSVWRRSPRRLSWLTINIGLNILAASIIAAYQETLAAVIALAVFLPIVSDMSGCSGSQAIAVSMRELSLGLVSPREALRVWAKELSVGLINGLVLGVVLGLAAWAWKGNVYLGAVVGGALALNTVVAVSIGGTVPLLLKRMRLDPALASGPVLTTITDMCGFFLILSFASAALPLLRTGGP